MTDHDNGVAVRIRLMQRLCVGIIYYCIHDIVLYHHRHENIVLEALILFRYKNIVRQISDDITSCSQAFEY